MIDDRPIDETVSEVARALFDLTELLTEHDPDSEVVRSFLERHGHLPHFKELADEVLRLEFDYRSRGDNGEGEPEPVDLSSQTLKSETPSFEIVLRGPTHRVPAVRADSWTDQVGVDRRKMSTTTEAGRRRNESPRRFATTVFLILLLVASGVALFLSTDRVLKAAQEINQIKTESGEQLKSKDREILGLKEKVDGMNALAARVAELEQSVHLVSQPSGIQLGMVIPYFGTDLPDGYVWADGHSEWPDKPWVPVHLRGKPVPNFSGRELRGITGVETVGSLGGSDIIAAHTTATGGAHEHRIPPP